MSDENRAVWKYSDEIIRKYYVNILRIIGNQAAYLVN